ncbi:MAG: phasin family protein [Methyloceanibacter sp.]
MAQNQPFELPKQLRELAEKNVEQARAAYAQFMDAMTQAMSAWSTAPSNLMTSGFRDVQELAIRFAKENAEAGFALAKEFANAKDIQGVITLQSRYAQTQLQSYAHQAQELGRLMAEAVESMKSRS